MVFGDEIIPDLTAPVVTPDLAAPPRILTAPPYHHIAIYMCIHGVQENCVFYNSLQTLHRLQRWQTFENYWKKHPVYHTLSITISLSPHVNSLLPQVKCENWWGGKEFWCVSRAKKVPAPGKKKLCTPLSLIIQFVPYSLPGRSIGVHMSH